MQQQGQPAPGDPTPAAPPAAPPRTIAEIRASRDIARRAGAGADSALERLDREGWSFGVVWDTVLVGADLGGRILLGAAKRVGPLLVDAAIEGIAGYAERKMGVGVR